MSNSATLSATVMWGKSFSLNVEVGRMHTSVAHRVSSRKWTAKLNLESTSLKANISREIIPGVSIELVVHFSCRWLPIAHQAARPVSGFSSATLFWSHGAFTTLDKNEMDGIHFSTTNSKSRDPLRAAWISEAVHELRFSDCVSPRIWFYVATWLRLLRRLVCLASIVLKRLRHPHMHGQTC